MTKTVAIADAQHQLAELVAQAVAGTEIILTDGDTIKIRLVPVSPQPRRRTPGLHQGSMTTTDDFDAPLDDDFWTGAP
jgi:antitoxin (DNA-binding transcriptional repressor) of toxin-antitoxin stability system